ncbi:MAG TPA: hypothetical protein VJV21_02490 [Pyrinomonadaceae bacterium]|nr:hypothetical protein [Pyrinomonadaceae bacterium]
MQTWTKIVLVCAIGVLLGSVGWFTFPGRSTVASQDKSKRPLLSKLPTIKNCLQHVTVVKAELLMRGDSQVASLELQNDAQVDIVSISIEQIAQRERHATNLTGFKPDAPPETVIASGQRKTLTLGNLDANSPIRVGGALFANGEEEGCKSSLKEIHQLKDFNTKKDVQQK